MNICKYCNSTQEAEGQIFMLPFTEDHSGNLTLISAKQSFRGCIYLSILDLWMSRSVTLTFYLIIIFRSVKAEIQICSSFTTPVVFNCTSSRQGIQNKIREKKSKRAISVFSHSILRGFMMSLCDDDSDSYSKKTWISIQVSICISFLKFPLETLYAHISSTKREEQRIWCLQSLEWEFIWT